MTAKSPRGIKSAFTNLNEQINQLAERRSSAVTIKRNTEREAHQLKEHIISLSKMLGGYDAQMLRLLKKHERLEKEYLQSICK